MILEVTGKKSNIQAKCGDIVEIRGKYYIIIEAEIGSGSNYHSKYQLRHVGGFTYFGSPCMMHEILRRTKQ